MLRDNLTGLIEPMFSSAGAYPLALCTDRNKSSDDRPQHALKIPARQGGIYALTENVTSPFHAEPRHDNELLTSDGYFDVLLVGDALFVQPCFAAWLPTLAEAQRWANLPTHATRFLL